MKRWCCLLVGVVMGLGLAAAPARAEIRFEEVAAEQTGVREVLQAWYDEEMKRQGGPGKVSHGWWPWGLRAFDFDRDGDLDLLASHHGVPRSIILKSQWRETGDLRFENATASLGVDHRDLPGADDRPWIWDIDGDGWLDIAGFSDESKPNSAFNRGGKKFLPTDSPLFPGVSHPREVIDLDGDGYLDLDGGKKGCWYYLPDKKRFRHDEQPRHAMPDDFPAELLKQIEEQSAAQNNRFFRLDFLTHDVVGYDTLGYAPRPIDLNADGVGDLVVHGSGGYGAVYLGRYLIRDAQGKLVDKSEQLGLPIAGAPILIDDLSGDGRTDVLIVGKEAGGVYVQGDDGKYVCQQNALTEFLRRRGPYLLRAWRADFDNDGDADLVLSNPRLGREAVFENHGGGRFDEVLTPRGWDSNPIAIADFDQDGRLDLAIGGGPGDDSKLRITFYLNRSEATGGFCTIQPRGEAPNPYAVGAVVEVFRGGDLDKPDARPLLIEKAHSDGTPLHAGLGDSETFDLRVTPPSIDMRKAGAKKAGAIAVRALPANRRVTVDLASGNVETK
ncbi:MAG: FG-GAP-like repeat-containing protein [Pirellulaceae bacterium]